MSLAVAVVKDGWVKFELSPIRWSEASPNELSSLSGGSSHEKEMQQTETKKKRQGPRKRKVFVKYIFYEGQIGG